MSPRMCQIARITRRMHGKAVMLKSGNRRELCKNRRVKATAKQRKPHNSVARQKTSVSHPLKATTRRRRCLSIFRSSPTPWCGSKPSCQWKAKIVDLSCSPLVSLEVNFKGARWLQLCLPRHTLHITDFHLIFMSFLSFYYAYVLRQ